MKKSLYILVIILTTTINIAIIARIIIRNREDISELMKDSYYEGYRDACDSVYSILSTEALEKNNDTSCVAISFTKDTIFYVLPASKDNTFFISNNK